MRFVTAVEREFSDGLQCAARISSEAGLAAAGRARALLCLEAAARTAAAWEALRRLREPGGAGPRVGYVVAIRDAEIFTSSIPGDEPFSATGRLEAATLPLTHYAAEVAVHDEVVVRGKIATVLVE